MLVIPGCSKSQVMIQGGLRPLGRLGCRCRSHPAPSAFGTETFSSLNDLRQGLRKMRGNHDSPVGERRVPYGRDHERHFPDRGRDIWLDLVNWCTHRKRHSNDLVYRDNALSAGARPVQVRG